ncbi:MAG: tetratricopeptide repeat protein [Lysobacterales bacterium]|nr:MAG: tetratricopeptide repeat protein [Xanthomonadales bacterium]
MKDQRGVDASSDNSQSLETYERALRAFNTYRGDPVAIIDEALETDPDFAMGHVLRGHIHLSMWEKSVLPEIKKSVAKLNDLDNRNNDRERRHARALDQWVSGDWDGARGTLDRLLAEYPRDLLALQIGHLSDFFHGDRENLRGRVARAMPAWTRDDSGYAFLLGMHAFGLEECGSYAVAEEAGRHALDLEPDDCWAQHELAHVMEMQARQAEGIAFMEGRTAHWAQTDNAFRFHNWWHTALYNLDQDRFERTLEIYDEGVRSEPAEIQLMLLDAVALLWRMHLRGLDVGNRWSEVADLYEKDDEDGFYAFNDMHAMMAFAATDRSAAAATRLAAMEAAAEGEGTNAMMMRMVGLPIARGIEAFRRERYGEAIGYLMPVRYRAHVFGGSHAQRDIVHRTLIEAALRDGDKALATALSNERTSLKPNCPFSWQLHERAVSG